MNLNLELALAVAAQAHVGQTRKVGSIEVPYIVHPIQVMTALAFYGETNEDVLSAALLHDAVEDSDNRDYVRGEIRLKLGKKILSIVDKLTLPIECADGGSPTYDKKKKYAHIAELLNGGDLDAIKVKLVDRLCNLTDMSNNKEYWRASKYAKQFLDCIGDGFLEATKNDSISQKLYSEITCFVRNLS